MKLMVQTALIFFGTLLAAGLLALGDPQGPSLVLHEATGASAASTAAVPASGWREQTAKAQPAH
jgi:hypothetical protein